jgi:P27 family predicted phage terminase small subunit
VKPAAQPTADALKKAPPAPKHFSEYARAEWKRIIPDVIARGIVTRADLGGIEELCMARGLARELETKLRDPATGDIDMKLARLQDKAIQTARQLAAEFGLSPVSRARVASAGPAYDEDVNPLAIGRNRP